jgi:DNA polymerase III alpha subunit
MTIVRTGYSFKHAAGHLRDVVSRVRECGFQTLAVADTFSTYSFVKLTKLAQAEGLRMVYGVDLLMARELGARRQGQDRWTFLALDSLRPLHDLIDKAALNSGREPCLTYQEALDAPGVIKVMGEAAVLSDPLLAKPSPDLFLGLSPANPRGQVNLALSQGHPLLALSNNKYPREEDLEFYRVTLGRDASSQTYPMHVMSDPEWISHLSWVPGPVLEQALLSRDEALGRCQATLKRANLLVPHKPKSLRELCLEGARDLGCDLQDPTYAARLDRELAMIEEKEFEDYFHIVADIMRFARQHMCVGPARGSSCGSLACYLLRITAIDPIPHGLIFERFIDVTRKDLPDIDIDFSEVNRGKVFKYMADTYGQERSARLGSVNMFKAKAALNQVGTSLRIPKARINELSNVVIKRSTGDARADSTIEDALHDTTVGQRLLGEHPEMEIVSRMEWHPANAAQHAAGMVLTDTAVRDYVAVNARTGATMCDKKDAEDLNLLKIDALGLTQLSIFERCLELLGLPQRSDFLEKLPLDDPLAFRVLNERRYSGIFQFLPGTATVTLVDRILALGGRVDRFSDLVALTANVRPGPLKTGQAEEWIRRRVGCNPVSYPHPSLEPYLESTLGLIVFQEQILSIGRELGGLTWEDVTALRKAMSKSLGREYFDKFGDRWKAGIMEKTGMAREVADAFWLDMCSFGSWAFNLSHSVAYAHVTYWCLWLKAHHPLEFSAASLDSQRDPFQQVETLRELRREGVDYMPVDPDHSTDKWEVSRGRDDHGHLLGPLTNVVGVGPKKLRQIMDHRENGGELTKGLRDLLVNSRTKIDSLDPIKEAFGAKNLRGMNIVSQPQEVASIRGGGDVCIYALVRGVKPAWENDPMKVAKRGYRLEGPDTSVQFWARDDSGEIYCKIGAKRFKSQEPGQLGLGEKFMEKARSGKSLYAIKGWVPPDFRMIHVSDVRFVGDMDEPEPKSESKPEPKPEPVETPKGSPDQRPGDGRLQEWSQGAQLALSL